jgi:hypothetical protein
MRQISTMPAERKVELSDGIGGLYSPVSLLEQLELHDPQRQPLQLLCGDIRAV